MRRMAGFGGYHTIRIPSMVRTNDGTLLAFAEGRVSGQGDDGNIETRSWDGGTPIYDGPSAYSDQVKLDAKTSGVLFEAGATGPYERITFVRFRP